MENTSNDKSPITYNRKGLLELLPYKNEFLMPDSVEIDTQLNTIRGKMFVNPESPFVKGHFGILAGVIQTEFAQQVAAAYLMTFHPDLRGLAQNFSSEINALLKGGDTLIADVAIDRIEVGKKGGNADVSAQVYSQDKPDKVSKITFSPTIVSKGLFERMIRPPQS